MYRPVVHPTSIFSVQVWTILGIFYWQLITVPKIADGGYVRTSFPTRGARKLATCTRRAALNGTRGDQHRQVSLPFIREKNFEVRHISRCKQLDTPGRYTQQASHDKTRHMTEVMLRDSAVNNKRDSFYMNQGI